MIQFENCNLRDLFTDWPMATKSLEHPVVWNLNFVNHLPSMTTSVPSGTGFFHSDDPYSFTGLPSMLTQAPGTLSQPRIKLCTCAPLNLAKSSLYNSGL